MFSKHFTLNGKKYRFLQQSDPEGLLLFAFLGKVVPTDANLFGRTVFQLHLILGKTAPITIEETVKIVESCPKESMEVLLAQYKILNIPHVCDAINAIADGLTKQAL